MALLMRWIGLVALLASSCRFEPGALPSDAAPDGPPPITVGFAKTTTLADEASGVVPIRVVLSKPAEDAISVDFAITGGTATRTVDYTGNDGTLTFAVGDVEQTIDITIGPDGMEEPDETVVLELQSVTGAGAAIVNKDHTLTINANVLPRVTFTLGASSGDEAQSPTIDVTLTPASPLNTSVQIAVMGGTATANGVDYGLSATTVTFAPNITTASITLNVVDDALDEDAETAIIELTNPINVLLGTTATRTHTITDLDNPPTVSFAGASSSIGEAGVMTNVVVQLSGPSGKAVSVPFSVENTSTAANTDYALATATPLMFAAGATMMNIQVNITQDTALEMPETVVLTLGTPTNATAVAPTTHTLTIVDDDQTCLGSGSYTACYPTPTADLTIPAGTIDTDTSTMCAAAQPTPWTGQPASCFIVARNITVSGFNVVFGSRPLVLFASGTISITGGFDASSHRFPPTSGPGAAGQTCTAFARGATNAAGVGGGGGAGGTFRTKGGDGGNGDGQADTGGLAATPDAQPTILRAGCTGQGGGKGNTTNGNNGGLGGLGGGALYLAASGTITINSGAVMNVSGAGATAQTSLDNGTYAGGGGGGSGGMLKIQAQQLVVTGAILMANGGGGSSGGDNNTPGSSGFDPLPTAANNPGIGGPSGGAGAAGGNGWGGTTAAQPGANGGSGKGGGGGGGGGGFIQSNLPLTGASVSAGEIVTN